MPPARLEWLRNNLHTIDNNKIAHYFPVDSWILVKFGGEIHTNYSSAMESGFFDLENRIWLEEWYSIFDIDESFFPYPVLSGEIIGNVSKSIQTKLNLHPDTEIVAGLPDTQAALLAANSITPGSIGVVLGSTTPVQAVSENLFLDPEEHTWASGISIKNLCNNYIVEASTGITGQIVKWIIHVFDSNQKGEFSEPSQQLYDTLRKKYQEFDISEQQETEVNITSHGVFANLGPLPLATTSTVRLAGEFYFPSPSGVDEFYINQNQLIGAVFDNIMFAVSKNIEYVKEIASLEQYSLSVLGGISRYSLLCQRISDLQNKPVTYITNHEASIQGSLILCDVASGKIKNLSDLENEFSENNDLLRIDPRSAMTSKLQKKYKKWLRTINF